MIRVRCSVCFCPHKPAGGRLLDVNTAASRCLSLLTLCPPPVSGCLPRRSVTNPFTARKLHADWSNERQAEGECIIQLWSLLTHIENPSGLSALWLCWTEVVAVLVGRVRGVFRALLTCGLKSADANVL